MIGMVHPLEASIIVVRSTVAMDRYSAKCEMSRGGEDPMLIEGSPYPYVPSHTDWSSLSEMKKQVRFIVLKFKNIVPLFRVSEHYRCNIR